MGAPILFLRFLAGALAMGCRRYLSARNLQQTYLPQSRLLTGRSRPSEIQPSRTGDSGLG